MPDRPERALRARREAVRRDGGATLPVPPFPGLEPMRRLGAVSQKSHGEFPSGKKFFHQGRLPILGDNKLNLLPKLFGSAYERGVGYPLAGALREGFDDQGRGGELDRGWGGH